MSENKTGLFNIEGIDARLRIWKDRIARANSRIFECIEQETKQHAKLVEKFYILACEIVENGNTIDSDVGRLISSLDSLEDSYTKLLYSFELKSSVKRIQQEKTQRTQREEFMKKTKTEE